LRRTLQPGFVFQSLLKIDEMPLANSSTVLILDGAEMLENRIEIQLRSESMPRHTNDPISDQRQEKKHPISPKRKPPQYKHLLKPVRLPSDEMVPGLGQGTWYMGEDPRRHQTELAALKLGIDLGMTLIDTAEMYGDGRSELLVGEATAGQRQRVFLVSKVLPQNAGRERAKLACENSLKRLRTDCLDLYLLHWRGPVPLEETVEVFNELVDEGKIRYWGVSNFDLADMQELVDIPGGEKVATNQVLYNLTHRGIEWDLLPWCRERRIPIMAYSPFDHGWLKDQALEDLALRFQVTTFQLALAWVLQKENVIAIPKASEPHHVAANRDALKIQLGARDLEELDRIFPPPNHAIPLEVI
jgi:diketogulonate reductase-like aldo/keto reductase